MKKFLMCILAATVILLGGTSCSEKGPHIFNNDCADKQYVDSVVKDGVQNLVNPVFNSVDEAITFQSLELEGAAIDYEFDEMPEEVLKNVASVLIKREGHASKRAIIYEYRANKEVYNNLPAPDDATTKNSKGDGTSAGGISHKPDTINMPQNETRLTQHDTVVGGKTYKVKTKTEVTYE